MYDGEPLADDVSILAFAGSARVDSLNKKLVRVAARGAEAAGAKVTVLDLADLRLPLYNGDLEAAEGLPAGAAELRRLLAEHGGLLVASPENNGSISAELKNAIDWATRSEQAQPDISRFTGKIVALLSASPGPLGGLRGLVHVRAILDMIGCIVLPEQINVRNALAAFDESGELTDERQRQRVLDLGGRLAKFMARVGPAER